jgi:hypothetical protein
MLFRIAQKGFFDLGGRTVKVGFRHGFAKDLTGVKDKSLLRRVKAIGEVVEKAEYLQRS